jgi:hypothetical protein
MVIVLHPVRRRPEASTGGPAMTARSRATRRLIVLGVVAMLCLAVASACGSGASSDAGGTASPVATDRFAGTWVQVDDPKTGLIIAKGDGATYRVADPNGQHAFVAKLSADGGRLTGVVDLAAEGDAQTTVRADVVMTLRAGGLMTFEASAGRQKVTFDLERQSISPSPGS